MISCNVRLLLMRFLLHTVSGQAAGRMGPPGHVATQESSSSGDAQRGADMPAYQGPQALGAEGGLAEAALHLEGSSNIDDPQEQQEQPQHQPLQASILPGAAQQPAAAQVTTREPGTIPRKRGAALGSPAESESSSEEESSEEGTPSGNGLAVPISTEQQKLSLPAHVPQQQQGPVQAAAQGQPKAPGAAAHNNSGSSEASSSSSGEEDSLEPPSKPAPVPPPAVPSSALQHLQPGAAPSALQGNGGRKEGASSSDSALKSSSPEKAGPAGQYALHGLPAGRQQAAAQQAGVDHQGQAAQNSSSSGEEESRESSEEGQPPQPAKQQALAGQRALEAAAAADDSASEDESSSPEPERDAHKLARQPGQGSRGALQNGVLGGGVQAASSSSRSRDDDESSEEDQQAGQGPVKQAADKATGKPAAAAQKDPAVAAQEQYIPMTRSSKRRAEQHGAINGQAAAGKGEENKDSAPEQTAPPGGALSAENEAPAALPVRRAQGRQSKHAETHNGAAHAAKGRNTRSGAATQAAAAPEQQQEDALNTAKRQRGDQGRPQQAAAAARDAALVEESSSSSEEERQEMPRTQPAGAAKGKTAAANDEPRPSGSKEAGTPR